MFLFCAGENFTETKEEILPEKKNILWRQDLDERL